MAAKRKRQKLSAGDIKAIFVGTDSAAEAAERHHVSPTLVYLIRQGRIHKAVTKGLRAPKRQTASAGRGRSAAPRIDVNRLADKIADAVVKRVTRELADRLRGKR